MATAKEELLVLGIKASSYYLRQVAVTYYRGTRVVRNLKFLTLFRILKPSSLLTNITIPTQVVVIGKLPCVTNNLFFLLGFFIFSISPLAFLPLFYTLFIIFLIKVKSNS